MSLGIRQRGLENTSHTNSVQSVVELSDGRIASASIDGTVQVWDPADPDTVQVTYTRHTNNVQSVVELSDGRMAASECVVVLVVPPHVVSAEKV